MDIEFKGKPIGQLWDNLSIRKTNEYNWLTYIDWKWKKKEEEHCYSRLKLNKAKLQLTEMADLWCNRI